MLDVSVIIPNLHSPVIGLTLASLERQTYSGAWEVLVVGQDRHGLVKEGGRVHHLITPEPVSPAKARNLGGRAARGEVVVFMDADCIARPEWLAVLAAEFADPTVTVVGGGIDIEAENYWTLADNLSMFHDYLSSLPPGEKRQLPSLNLAMRRAVFLDHSGFDERYPRAAGEDADLTLRLRQKGHRLLFQPKAIVAHKPTRASLRDMLRHTFYQGKYSTKVDKRYVQEKLPWPASTRFGIFLCAPLLATAAALRVVSHSSLLSYWPLLPAIYVSKISWCLGAAQTIWNGTAFKSVGNSQKRHNGR
jgi:GT2 family glycosyltransferase